MGGGRKRLLLEGETTNANYCHFRYVKTGPGSNTWRSAQLPGFFWAKKLEERGALCLRSFQKALGLGKARVQMRSYRPTTSFERGRHLIISPRLNEVPPSAFFGLAKRGNQRARC